MPQIKNLVVVLPTREGIDQKHCFALEYLAILRSS